MLRQIFVTPLRGHCFGAEIRGPQVYYTEAQKLNSDPDSGVCDLGICFEAQTHLLALVRPETIHA